MRDAGFEKFSAVARKNDPNGGAPTWLFKRVLLVFGEFEIQIVTNNTLIKFHQWTWKHGVTWNNLTESIEFECEFESRLNIGLPDNIEFEFQSRNLNHGFENNIENHWI